jgi:hypothetical protein
MQVDLEGPIYSGKEVSDKASHLLSVPVIALEVIKKARPG